MRSPALRPRRPWLPRPWLVQSNPTRHYGDGVMDGVQQSKLFEVPPPVSLSADCVVCGRSFATETFEPLYLKLT